jgi:hypothetical protein
VFIMFVPDRGELAYGSGDGVVWSNEVALVAAEGDAADLPWSGVPVGCYNISSEDKKWYNFKSKKKNHMSSHTIGTTNQGSTSFITKEFMVNKIHLIVLLS